MRNPGGYILITEPGVAPREYDTFTCVHCNAIVIVEPKGKPEDAGGWCAQCAKPICPRCAAHGRCVPFEKALEESEARQERLRTVERLANDLV